MDNILVLLEKYFNVVESLILSEILTESEIFDILNKTNIKIEADLKAIQSKKYSDNDKTKFKKTILDTVSLMQRAKRLYTIINLTIIILKKQCINIIKKIYFQNLLIFGDCAQNIMIDLN